MMQFEYWIHAGIYLPLAGRNDVLDSGLIKPI